MLAIHIGLRKAASASIQSFLTINEETLRSNSIDYPISGRRGRKDHHNLCSEVMDRKKFSPELGTISDLIEHIGNNIYKTTIISSEMFEGASSEAVISLYEKLAATGEEMRVIMVVRDLISLMPSSYFQKIRFGIKTYDFDEFFESRIKEPRVHFSDTAKIWAEIFGWENLRIIDLNAARPAGMDLMDDFLNASGVGQRSGPDFHLIRPGIVNASSGWRVLEAIRALYLGKHQLPENHFLIRFLGARGDNSLQRRKKIERAAVRVGESRRWNDDLGNYITKLQAQTCLDIHRSSIMALNACLPAPLDMPPDLEARGFVERDFPPEVANIPAADLRSFYDQMGEVLKREKASFHSSKAAKLAQRDA